ncbi:MAG: cache domain-containing protein [Pseudomonadota bacterium]
MKHLFSKSALLFSLAFMAGGASAAPSVTADEAVALVKEAVQYIKKNGREKAFAEFNNSKGHFVNGELYIVATSLDGVVLAHGANPKLLGKNIREIKDTDGKLFVQEQITVAKTKGSGWVDFRWPNPVTKDIEPKTVYLERMDDLLIAGGIYKK